MTRNLFRSTRFWIFIILLLLLFSVAIAYGFHHIQQESCIAKIYQNGQLIRTIDLLQVKSEESFLLEAPNGGSNTITIAPGKISVQEATCPDHVCINQGWISDGVYPIVCLPNKLVIRIENDSSDTSAPDIMTQ